jgi:hypothetical protein
MLRVARLRSAIFDDELDNDAMWAEAHRSFEEVHARMESARTLLDDFSRAARAAIVGERSWFWKRRRSARPVHSVRDSCEEEAATDGEIEAPR